MDLIRAILFEVEGHQDPTMPFAVHGHGYSPEQVSYHVMTLNQAGLIDALNMGGMGSDWQPRSLTWEGHEFLEAARNDTVWHKAKAELKDRGLSLPFALVKELLLKIAASAAGLA